MLYENLEMQKAGDSWAMAGAACVVAAKGDAAGAAGMLRVAVGAAEGRGEGWGVGREACVHVYI